MSYFATHSPFKREVPMYARPPLFRIDSVELTFKASRPFYFRYAFKTLVGALMNSTRAVMEFYEENVCYFFPCYEVRFLMSRRDESGSAPRNHQRSA
jgi:hypothetical protein